MSYSDQMKKKQRRSPLGSHVLDLDSCDAHFSSDHLRVFDVAVLRFIPGRRVLIPIACHVAM
jgi:hypothetical protein